MAFFTNRAINRFQIHAAIAALAQGAGGIFIFVYLLRAGVTVPLVLCAIAGMHGSRFLLRPVVLPIARRIGLRRLLIVGTVLESVVYPMLAGVRGADAWLVLIIGVSAIGSVAYWTSYHAYFASLGDVEQRGDQVGLRQALTTLVNIVAPALGGLAMTRLGPSTAFDLVAVVQILAAVPFIGAPDVAVAEEPRDGRREYLYGALLQSTDGWMDAGFYYLWQIALFVTLGERYAAYGGAMALAGLVGAAASLAIGRLIDLGHGRRSAVLAYGFTTGVIVLEAASLSRPALAVAANALLSVAATLFAPVMMTRVYNLAKASPCPLRFHMATEGGWDLGGALGCLLCAGIVASGLGFAPAILTALLGALAAGTLLARGYGPRTV